MTAERWGVEWHSRNRLDGDTNRYIMWNQGDALLFRTRREARQFIRERYGYIAGRADLRAEPHGWRMPQPVKVEIRKIGHNGRIEVKTVANKTYKEHIDESLERGLKEAAAMGKVLRILKKLNRTKGPEASQRVLGAVAVLKGAATAVFPRVVER